MKKKPKDVVIGSVSLPLYVLGDGRVAFSDRFGGPRKVRKFADEGTARAEAEKLIFKWLSGNRVREDLTAADLQAYQHAVTTCEQFQLPLSVAIDEYAHVKRLADGKDLAQIVKAGVATLQVPQVTIHAVTAELLARKKRMGRKFYRIKELEFATTLLTDNAFGNRVISAISTPDLDTLLDTMKCGGRRRNNVRSCLVTIWRYARKKGYLSEPLGETAAEKTDKASEQKNPISIAPAPAMQWWLENISETFLPWLASIAFAGVRTEEVCPDKKNEKDALKWEDFRWTKNYVQIRPEVSKVGERRLCPLLPNLVSWLAPYKDRTGYVVPPGARPDNEIRRLNRLSEKLTKLGKHPVPGLKWEHNIHRHSFGSYRMAIIKNMPQLEYEMGNSRDMVKNNYHDAREEDVAKDYFNIYRGGKPANLVDIGAAKDHADGDRARARELTSAVG